MLLPVLTRYLEPSEYGEVAVFHVWVALMGAVCGLSVPGAAVRKYYDYDEPDKEIGIFISACLMVLVLSSSIIILILIPVSGLVSDVIGLSKVWLLIGVLCAFCNFLVQLRLGQWRVRNKPKSFGVFQVSMSLLNLLLSLLFVVILMLGVSGRLIGQTAAIVIFGLIALLLLRRDGLIKISWRPDLMAEALRYGIPLVPHVLGSFLLITVDRAVISSQLGLEQAGYYMVAVQFAMVMSLLLDSFNKAYSPWLYALLNRDIIKEKVFVVKLTYAYAATLSFCVILAFLIGGELLVFIAGQKYEPAANIIGWLVLAKAFHGMYYMVCGYIFYMKKTSQISKVTIFSGIVNVGLMIVLSKQFGLIGAAWAMCISMFLQWIITWNISAKLVSMPWTLRTSY
jgi:O-antigen/teichoic acid export membrane protein